MIWKQMLMSAFNTGRRRRIAKARMRNLFRPTFLTLEDRVVPAAFTAGDLVVYRIGSGTGSLVNTGNPVFLDEYSTTGTLVQSLPLPTVTAGAQQGFFASGTATSEGFMTLSADGHYLIAPGYVSTNATSLATSTVNRDIARIDSQGLIDTSTVITDNGANNIRSATSDNGTNIWIGSASTGVRYTTFGSSGTSTQVSTTVTNVRNVETIGGQLYVSDSSGTATRLGTVGTGYPNASGQTITTLPGIPASAGSPYAFAFADLSTAVAGNDTLYVADDAAGIQKYSLVGGTWTLNGTIGTSTNAVRGLTLSVSGTTVNLYATSGLGTATGGATLFTVTDTAGYNAAPSTTTLTAIASLSTTSNEAFRGVAFAPTKIGIATTTTLTAPANGSAITAGASVTFTATVTPASGVAITNGSVEFRNGANGAVVTSVPLSGGTVSGSSVTVTTNFTPSAGVYDVYAVYVSGAGYLDSTSSAHNSLTVGNPTTTAVTTSALTVAPNTNVTYTATVSGSGTPTGSVQFSDNGTNFGSPVALVSGSASVTTQYASTGNHRIVGTYIPSGAYNASTSAAVPQNVLNPFTPGDLIVEQVGTGAAALTSAATDVILDEINPITGAIVQQLFLPTSAYGSNAILTESGSASSGGFIMRTTDGHYLSITGYTASTGTAGVAATLAAATNRVVGRIDASGNIDTSTRIGDGFDGNNVRASLSADGLGFWVSGAGNSGTGGVRYVALGSAGVSTSVSPIFTNTRTLAINPTGQLFVDAGAGTSGVVPAVDGPISIGSGLPITGGQSEQPLVGFPTAADANGTFPSPYQFVFQTVGSDKFIFIADDRVDGYGGFSKYQVLSEGTPSEHWLQLYTAQPFAAAISNVTESGTTVTVTAIGHGFTSLQNVSIAGVGTGYNGTKTITVVDANTFTFTAAANLPVVTAYGSAFATPLSGGLRGLVADATNPNILYATTSDPSTTLAGANKLVKITDTGSGATFSTLSTAATNSVYRGVSIAPVAAGATATTTTLSADKTTSTYGEAVMFTAAVTAGSKGVVSFREGGVEIGAAVIDTTTNTATFVETTSLPAGVSSHNIVAVYTGDATHAASTSTPAVVLTVSKASTTTTVVATPSNSQTGGSVTFTATVVQGNNTGVTTGIITFTDGSTTLGTATLAPVVVNNGSSGLSVTYKASLTVATGFATVGAHTVTATYAGDTNFTGSNGNTVVNVVNPSTTVVTTNTTNPTASPSVMVSYHATVTGLSVTPTGSVQFFDNLLPIGSPVTLNASGQADSLAFATSLVQSANSLTPGIHSITAVYTPDTPGATQYASSTGLVNQSVKAQPFNAADSFVYRIGDGTNPVGVSTGSAVFVDEYRGSTLIQSITFPVADSGTGATAIHALIQNGQQSATGQLSLSGDGQYLMLTGYDASLPTTLASVASVAKVTIGRIKFDGTVDTGVVLSDVQTGTNNVNAVYSPDGNKVYVAGAGGGIRYIANYTPATAAQTSTLIVSTADRIISLHGFANTLFADDSTGTTVKIGVVGTPGTLPTATSTMTPLAGIPLGTANSPNFPVDFYITDLDATANFSTTGLDTLYISDDGASFNNGSITKWEFDNGTSTWSLVGTITATPNGTPAVPGFYYLNGTKTGSTVNLLTTYSQGGASNTGQGNLYAITDVGGYTVGPDPAFGNLAVTTVASVGISSKETFHGVANAPKSATAFTPGNLVALRLGDGAAYNAQAPYYLDEFSTTPNATAVRTVAIPNTQPVGGTGNQPITFDVGSAAGNGQLTRTADGSGLVFGGVDSGINNGTYTGGTFTLTALSQAVTASATITGIAEASSAITSITESGTTATVTTSAAVGVAVGDSVVIAGSANANFNGTYAVTGVSGNTFTYKALQANLGNAGAGGTAKSLVHTVTTSAAHSFTTGDTVTIAGASAYNGTYIIAAASGNTFKFTALALAGNATGGSATDLVATATTTDPNGFTVGQIAVVSGATPVGYNTSSGKILTILSPTQFRYVASAGNLAAGSGFTANTKVAVQSGTPTGSADRVIAIVGNDPAASDFLDTTLHGQFYVGDDNRGAVAVSRTGPVWTVGHPNQAGSAVSQGVLYFPDHTPSAGTQVSATTNIRGGTIGFDNRVYFSTASGLPGGVAGIFTDTQALPTTATPATDVLVVKALFSASKLGGIYLADVNGDGVVNNGDRIYFEDDGTVGGFGTGGIYMAVYDDVRFSGNHWSPSVQIGEGLINAEPQPQLTAQLRGLTGTVIYSGTPGVQLYASQFDNVAGNNSYILNFNDNTTSTAGVFRISGAAFDGTTATITTSDALPANFTVGAMVSVDSLSTGAGVTNTTGGYNGVWTITAVTANSFSYAISTNLPAIGTLSTIPTTAVAAQYINPSIVQTLADGTVTVQKGTFAAQGIRGIAFAPVLATTVGMTVSDGNTTGSSITVAPNSQVTFTATLTNSQVTPSGAVTFIDQNTNTVLGTGTISIVAGVATATFQTSGLVGNHLVQAYFAGGGTSALAPARSGSVTVNAAGATASTTTLASSLASAAIGRSVTFTATVSATATGTVSFYSGLVSLANLLGTSTISGTTATFTTSFATAGIQTIIAVYNGNATFAASQNTQTVPVDLNVTAVITASSNNVALNATPTYTVTLNGNATLSNPVGTVQFFQTNTFTGVTTAIGTVQTLVAGANNTATASVTSPALANPGSYLVTATYTATGATNPYNGFAVDTIGSASGVALIETVKKAFTPGNLIAVQRGDGTVNLGSQGYLNFLVEYTTAGALIQKIALPNADSINATITTATEVSSTVTITTSAASGFVPGDKVTVSGVSIAGYNGVFTVATVSGNQFTYTNTNTTGTGLTAATGGSASGGATHALLLSGQSGAEGLLNRSADGRYLTLVGYDVPVGRTFVTSTFPFQYPRTIARIDLAGNVDTSTSIASTQTSSVPFNPLSVVTNDGNEFWLTSNLNVGNTTDSGIEYVAGLGAHTATQLGPIASDGTAIAISGGQVYNVSGTGDVQAVGSGLATTAGQTLTGLPNLAIAYATNFPGKRSPEQFVLLNTTDGTTNNPNVAYIADQANGLLKFWKDGTGNWQYGRIGDNFFGQKLVFAGGATGVIGNVVNPGASGYSVQLFVTGTNTQGTNANQIDTFTDTNAANQGFTAGNFGTTVFVGQSAGSPNGNMNFAGLAFAPGYTTAMTLASTPVGPLTVGNAVTFQATVTAPSSGGNTPTGVVIFYDGTAVIGQGTLNASGVATSPSINTLTAGTHSISAVYQGDVKDAMITGALPLVINSLNPTVTGVTESGFGNSGNGNNLVPATNKTLSRLTSLTVNFSANVDIAAGAFSLTNGTNSLTSLASGGIFLGGSQTTATNVNAVTLTFDPSKTGVEFGSLSDGHWTLSIDATKVTSTSGGVSLAPFTAVGNINRLYGDYDSNSTVDGNDLNAFFNTFGSSQGLSSFDPAADYDGNNTIDGNDLNSFFNNFGKSI